MGQKETLLNPKDQPPRSCARALANASTAPPVIGGRERVHGSSRGAFWPLAENAPEVVCFQAEMSQLHAVGNTDFAADSSEKDSDSSDTESDYMEGVSGSDSGFSANSSFAVADSHQFSAKRG